MAETKAETEPRYETWELPADGGVIDQERQINREVTESRIDAITTPEIYAETKTLRKWRVRVR